MKYAIKFKYRKKFAKNYQTGEARFNTLEKMHDFIVSTKSKYVDTYFEKYIKGELVSTFN